MGGASEPLRHEGYGTLVFGLRSKGSRLRATPKGMRQPNPKFGTSAFGSLAMARVFESATNPHSDPGRNTPAEVSIVVHNP